MNKPILCYLSRIILGLLLTAATSSSLSAAHIVGGELTYVCLGPDADNPGSMLYQFRMIVYRDCDGGGAQFDGLPQGAETHISVYRGDTNFELVNLGGFSGAILPLPPDTTEIRGGVDNPCIVIPSNLCVEKGEYTFTQSLPVIDENYYIIYQRCCRNGTINNIQSPGETGSTYSIIITPTAQLQCNSSPVFNNFPDILICVNEPLIFDHSATDIDGDQLAYRFCSPLSGGSQNDVAPNPDTPPPFEEVVFNLPTYSATRPLAGDPIVAIDPFSGMITGTPNFQNQHVVGICVDEFRNGELLSTVQRDFQFNITVCENLVNAGIGGTANSGDTYYISSCVDSTITIINTSFDEAFIDEYLWEFDIPGSTQPLSWSERDLTITFPGPGEYLGTMTLNPTASEDCSDQAGVRVVISSPMFPFFDFEYDTCVAGPVMFMDQSSIDASTIQQYDWDFGDGNTSMEIDPIHQYEIPGEKLVTLTVTDTVGCTESFQQTINWFPAPPIIVIEPSSSVGCPPEEISFTNLSLPIDTTYEITWDFGDDQFTEGLSPSTIYTVPGTYTVVVGITSPIGCFVSDTFPDLIFVDSLPEADFIYSPPRGVSNFAPEVEFIDLSFNAYFWDWKFADSQDSSILKDPIYVFQDTGKQEVELTVTSFYGCTDTLRQIVDVVPKITYYLPNAFTPNQDGLNETFGPVGFFRGIRNYRFGVWNRYGQLIFQTTDVEESWNGRYENSGKLSANGIYVVRVSFMGPRGKMEMFEGFATLLK